jgi:hypothetical protein
MNLLLVKILQSKIYPNKSTLLMVEVFAAVAMVQQRSGFASCSKDGTITFG